MISTSEIKLVAKGQNETAKMFAALQAQLERTRQRVQAVAQASPNARQQVAGIGSALQNVAAIAGGGRIASLIGQIKGIATAVSGLGVAMGPLLPAVLGLVAAWKAWEYARARVKRAEEEARRSQEELGASTIKAARAVLGAYDEQLSKVRALRDATADLNRATRQAIDERNSGAASDLRAEALRKMIAAGTEEERRAIESDMERRLAELRHAVDIQHAYDNRDDAQAALDANAHDSALARDRLRAAEWGRDRVAETSGRNSDAYREAQQAVEQQRRAIEELERRRRVLLQERAAAEARVANAEKARQEAALKVELEAKREAERIEIEAAERRERTEKRIADLRVRRAQEIAKAEERARDEAERHYTEATRKRLRDNMAGASIMDAAAVARTRALTSGPNAQFRRVSTGLEMAAHSNTKEDRRWAETKQYQDTMARYLAEINAKFDAAEAQAEGEF